MRPWLLATGSALLESVGVLLDWRGDYASPACSRCGGALDPRHLGYDYPLPDPIGGFTPDDLAQRIRTRTDAVLTIADYGSFIRVLLPVALDDGRHITFGVWLRISTAEEFGRIGAAWRGDGYAALTFQGQLTNAVQPWGADLVGVSARAAVLDARASDQVMTAGRSPPDLWAHRLEY